MKKPLTDYSPPRRLRFADATHQRLQDDPRARKERVIRIVRDCGTNENYKFDLQESVTKRQCCCELFQSVRRSLDASHPLENNFAELDKTLSCQLACIVGRGDAGFEDTANMILSRLPVLPCHLLGLSNTVDGWNERYLLPPSQEEEDIPVLRPRNLQVVRIIDSNSIKMALHISARNSRRDYDAFGDDLVRYVNYLADLAYVASALDKEMTSQQHYPAPNLEDLVDRGESNLGTSFDSNDVIGRQIVIAF